MKNNIEFTYKKPMVLLSVLAVICGVFAFASIFFVFDSQYNLFSGQYNTSVSVQNPELYKIFGNILLISPFVLMLLYSVFLYKCKKEHIVSGVAHLLFAAYPVYTLAVNYGSISDLNRFEIITYALIIIPFIFSGIYTICGGSDFTLLIVGPVFGTVSYLLTLARDILLIKTFLNQQMFYAALKIIVTLVAVFACFAVMVLANIREKEQ